jgi:hypothetical protein
VIAQDGETVAIGGLIARRDEKAENKIPWLGDLPGVGALFRFRTQNKRRQELLVILTPHIVRGHSDAARVLAEESKRMSWLLGDVVRAHGLHGMDPVIQPHSYMAPPHAHPPVHLPPPPQGQPLLPELAPQPKPLPVPPPAAGAAIPAQPPLAVVPTLPHAGAPPSRPAPQGVPAPGQLPATAPQSPVPNGPALPPTTSPDSNPTARPAPVPAGALPAGYSMPVRPQAPASQPVAPAQGTRPPLTQGRESQPWQPR